MRNRPIILKLGGSVITSKNELFKAKTEVVDQIAKEVASAKCDHLVIVHGGGSFGHPIAKKYKIHKGFRHPNQIIGFSETHKAMEQLNQIVIDAFLRKKIPVISIPPSSCVTTSRGRITEFNIPVREYIKKGFIPVVYGDAVMDEEWGMAILSGDQIVKYLAMNLEARRVIFGVDVDGVFTADPKQYQDAKLIRKITPRNFDRILSSLETSDVGDVTGGMGGKIKELVEIAERGIEVSIMNATKPGNVESALTGKDVLGTHVYGWEYKVKEAPVEPRKLDHIRVCLEKPVQAQDKTAGLEDIELIHNAIPEISKKDVDPSSGFLGHNLDAPIIIAAMTGGHPIAKKINATLAEAAKELNIGLGVGSQRAALEDPGLIDTFRVVREIAPDAFIIGNLGAPQLSRGYSLREIEKAVKMIDANAIAIHLNALQEAIQPEGETDFSGVTDTIGEISKKTSIPIIAKETGAGIAREEAQILEKSGIAAIDVGGAGGTTWAGVETYRAAESGDEGRNRIGKTFWDWGIPTAVSAFEVAQSTKLPVIATGGVRSGLDAAKLIALGASVVGVAFPLLQSAYRGDVNEVINTLNTMIEELRITMHLVGAKTIDKLKSARVIISGKTGQWLQLRGYEVSRFANRTIK